MKEPIIKTKSLSFTYDDDGDNSQSKDSKNKEVPALSDVNLEIYEGEYVAVLGHNGSGKSTLAKLLNMILIPTVGKIYVGGVDITDENFTEDDVFNVRRSIGMVFLISSIHSFVTGIGGMFGSG